MVRDMFESKLADLRKSSSEDDSNFQQQISLILKRLEEDPQDESATSSDEEEEEVLETEQTDNERVYTAKTVDACENLTEDENLSIHGANILTGETLLFEEYCLNST